MADKDVVIQDAWPLGMTGLFRDDFWPPPLAINKGGLSVSEDAKHVYVEAALPGLEAKDISIDLSHGTLTITGERKTEEKTDKKSYRTMQSSYGYQIDLPGNIKENEEPEAQLKNGMLTISFAKEAGSNARQIKIKG